MEAAKFRDILFNDMHMSYSVKCAATQVLAAYSDLNHGVDEKRNLDFFCNHAVHGLEAIEIAARCIKSYNEFNREAMEAIVDYFGKDAWYYFARESSVCVYVKPIDNIDLSLYDKDETKADEFHFDARLNMFRLWYD